jgi:hypothetical protein
MRMELCGITALAVASVLVGCGDDDGDVPDPTAAACDEIDEAGDRIEAATARDDDAPRIELGGEPFTVALSDVEPTYVRIDIAEESAAVLLLGAEDAVSALYHGDEEEELVPAGPVEHCADDIPEHFDVDFHEAGTYFLELAPSAASTLWLVLADATGHGHEEHAD